MPLSTVPVTVGSAENALQIQSCSYVRPLGIGTDWTYLFIAVGWALDNTYIDPQTAGTSTGAHLRIGVSNGTSFESTSGRVWAGYTNNTNASWTKNAALEFTGNFDAKCYTTASSFLYGGNQPYVIPQMSRLPVKGVWGGIGITVRKTGVSDVSFEALSGIPDASLSSTVNYNWDRCHLMANAGNITRANSILGYGSPASMSDVAGLTVGERDSLNSLCISWDRVTTKLLIGHVSIARWA